VPSVPVRRIALGRRGASDGIKDQAPVSQFLPWAYAAERSLKDVA
jgi:hypothetical protein